MNWQIGKARCRSDEYEAEIVGMHGAYYVGVAWLKSNGEIFKFNSVYGWFEDDHGNHVYDLLAWRHFPAPPGDKHEG